MENVSFDEIESKYSELTELNNSAKSNVYLVRSEVDGRIYIKKELKICQRKYKKLRKD